MTRVDTLVRDVKLKQSELSGRPQEERRQRLRELLRERTRGMTGEQRFELLNVLKFHFPPFGDVPRDKPPRADGLTLDDWDDEQKVARQLERLAAKSESRRRDVQELLRQLQLIPPPPAPLVAQVRQLLGLGASAVPQANRVWELMAWLVTFAKTGEDVTRNTCAAYGRAREFQGQRKLIDAMAEYVCLADNAPNGSTVHAELTDQFKRVGRRLLSVGALPRNFTDDFAARIAPARLEAGTGGWRKFKKLWRKWVAEIGGRETAEVKESIAKQFEQSLQRSAG